MLNIRNVYTHVKYLLICKLFHLPVNLMFRNQLFHKQNFISEYNRNRKKAELYDVSLTNLLCSVKNRSFSNNFNGTGRWQGEWAVFLIFNTLAVNAQTDLFLGSQ
jgi:hypothetical protein